MTLFTRIFVERAYDYAERAFLTVLGIAIVARFAPTLSDYPINVLLVISECAAVVMIVLRRPSTHIDLSAYAIGIALVGTTGSLLVRPGGTPLIPLWIGAAMMVTGFLLNIASKLSLNRSFGLTAANRGVQRQGPYRFMRHPMYAGYIITQMGFLLTNPTLWNVVFYAAAWSAQLLRISAEERVLMRDAEYRSYAQRVPYRLAPGLY